MTHRQSGPPQVAPDEADTPSFKAALAHLASPEGTPQPALVHALSDPRHEEVEAFTATWGTLPQERRRWLASRLLEAAEERFQVRFDRLFAQILDDDDEHVRCAALEGLWEDERPERVPGLLRMVTADPSAPVRARAATALGRFVYRGELGDVDDGVATKVIDCLLAVATDRAEEEEVRRRATEAAGYADREDVRALIDAHIDSNLRSLRLGALVAMGRSADSIWCSEVLAALDHEDPAMVYEAALAAGKLALEEAVERLAQLGVALDREIQMAAIWSLGEIGSTRASRALRRIAAQITDDDVAEAVDDAMAAAALTEGAMPWGIFG